jgi:cellulose synthase/poly-beta-1,6-N-acetylglucosamine synthase-like glycosyltransferase
MITDWRLLLGMTGAAWAAYVFVGYPLLLAAVARLRRIRPVAREEYSPRVSVLISARNEEKDIAWKVRETLAWDYPPSRLDIWVASDASDDRTDEILRGIGDPRVHFVRMERRGGKNRALNRLAQLAQGELFFFTDANSHVAAGCLRKMVRHFADERVGSVTGNSNGSAGDEETFAGIAVYWGHELLIRHLENQFGSVLVCDGAIFCIRRSLYTPCLPELANDLELPLQIGKAGYWLLHEPQARVQEKETASPWEELSRRRRICAQGALGMWKLRRVLKGIRAWQFFSHKFLRWLLAIPFLLVFLSSLLLAGQPVFAGLFALQLIFWGLALAGLAAAAGKTAPPKPLAPLVYLLVSCVGALAGVIDACAGRKFDVWESPSLTRDAEVRP